MKAGRQTLLLSLMAVAAIPNPQREWLPDAKHWFNHLLVSPDGSRFIFLHRWRDKSTGNGFGTRMFTANRDGGDLHMLDPYGQTSHFIWRDARHVLAWAWHPSKGNRFYLYTDKTERVEVVGADVMTVNGHCTYLPGNRWILNDTYPDKQRYQNPYLFDTATGKRHSLGRFYSPPEYAGEWRCDLHPRFSPDGRKVIIDSPHLGNGRQMYLIDVSGLVSPSERP
jgi:hypothetical protein